MFILWKTFFTDYTCVKMYVVFTFVLGYATTMNQMPINMEIDIANAIKRQKKILKTQICRTIKCLGFAVTPERLMLAISSSRRATLVGLISMQLSKTIDVGIFSLFFFPAKGLVHVFRKNEKWKSEVTLHSLPTPQSPAALISVGY